MQTQKPSSTDPPCWRLDSIYPSPISKQFQDDCQRLSELIDTLQTIASEQVDGFAASGFDVDSETVSQTVDDILDQAVRLSWRLDAYVAAVLDSEPESPAIHEAEQQVQAVLSRLVTVRGTVERWQTSHRSSADPTRSDGDTYLDERDAVLRAHRMSDAEEALATELHLALAQPWHQLRRKLLASMVARLPSDSTEQLLTMSELRVLESSRDRATRRRVYRATDDAWAGVAEPLAMVLTALKSEAALVAKRRGWSSLQEQALWAQGIEPPVLDRLLAAADGAVHHLQRYLASKARYLRVPDLAWYDLAAPVGQETDWSFEEAINLISQAFTQFDPEFGALVHRAVGEAWIDAEARPGKPSGGMCYAFGEGESRIRIDWQARYDSVRMLAHEFGHAYHALVLDRNKARTRQIESIPLPLWETMSKICEELTRQEAMRYLDSTHPESELALLDGFLGGVYRSVAEALVMYRFEDRLTSEIGARTWQADDLNQLLCDVRSEIVGLALDAQTPFPWSWAALPNFTLDGQDFYNLPYLFAQLLALGLSHHIAEEPTRFPAMLASALIHSGLEPITHFAAHLGVDLTGDQFWDHAVQFIGAEVDLYEQLVTAAMQSKI